MVPLVVFKVVAAITGFTAGNIVRRTLHKRYRTQKK